MSEDTRPERPDDADPSVDPGPRFRLGFVPGATPGKWARTWEQRLPRVPLDLVPVESADATTALRERTVEAAIARLPVDKDEFHAMALYDEVPMVVVARDHLLAATEESEHVTPADLAEDVLWVPDDDVLFTGDEPRPGRAPEPYDDGTGTLVTPAPATTAEAIAWAATGSGVVVVPMSLARLHRRKDVVHRVLDEGPEAPVGLVWLRDGLSEETGELVEEMVGIVRGRTANSSRGRAGESARASTKAASGKKASAGAAKTSGQSGRRGGAPGARRGAPPGGRRGRAGGSKGRGKRR
ncbi:LysR substrate-binding domain-containing protein [Isoptericola sp. b408]|uniref:LysR substrate-binding domain-containing protein n=1 Tax=Isoptericola sp. b408 TaxID=3064653 RepID=UPI00271410FD|nr:LysR substrate-binding domain-containing protein [Isoptericola sp. b408]MDO8152417.1 LysR substrate-binding domain-containing protein [Isoptericola sp. b408]